MSAVSLTSSMLRCEILKWPAFPRCTGVQIFLPPRVAAGRNVTLTSVNIREQNLRRRRRPGTPTFRRGSASSRKTSRYGRDINLLGRVLGRVLIEQEGQDLFETEEEVQAALQAPALRLRPGAGREAQAADRRHERGGTAQDRARVLGVLPARQHRRAIPQGAAAAAVRVVTGQPSPARLAGERARAAQERRVSGQRRCARPRRNVRRPCADRPSD